MSYYYPLGTKIDLTTIPGYSAAYFGFYHVAFLADDGQYYLDEQDRESILEALYFYDEHIRHMENYPYLRGDTTTYLNGGETRVFKQVLGLPDVIFDSLNLGQEILPQLHFREGLFPLKRDCYTELYSRNGKRWIIDDFKVYLMRRGIFFLNDETKKFVNMSDPRFPVFFDEKKIDSSILKPYGSFCGARAAIDLMNGECDESFLKYMERFDKFTINQLAMHFIDGITNPSIEKIADDGSKNQLFSNLIRRYIVAIVNMVFDEYFRNVLNIYTNKLSFLTVRKGKDSDLFAVSSYNGDMFSYDGRDFFFSSRDSKRISILYKDALNSEKGISPVLLYSRMRLPYEGFRKIKDDPGLTSKNLFSKLEFREGLEPKDTFLTIKRFDENYSYVPGNYRHLVTFLLRRLLDQGIYYYSRHEGEEERITIKVFSAKRCPELAGIFDSPSCSLIDNFYRPFLLMNGETNEFELEDMLKDLDKASGNTATSYFFSSFSDSTLDEAIKSTFNYFHVPFWQEETLRRFFGYLLGNLLIMMKDDLRRECLRKKHTHILSMIDGMPKETETYEPDLPLPYVIFGQVAYSFRERYFSQPYLCSCQKEAMESRIDYFDRRFQAFYPGSANDPHWALRKNMYILDHLGLPENLYHLIDCHKDIGQQIPYKDHICHLCNGTAPLYHDVIFENPSASRNTMFTYVRSIGSTKGIHLESIRNENFLAQDFFEQISNGRYRGIIQVDEGKIAGYLRKYIQIDEEDFVSLFSCFYTESFQPGDGTSLFYPLLSNDASRIRDMLFSCHPDNYKLILDNPWLFSRCVFFYNRLAVSYAYKEAQRTISGLDTDTYVDTVHVPGLKKPYIYLGRVFNAYSDKEDGDPVFCSCDYRAMRNLIEFFTRHFDNGSTDPKFLCPIVLGLSGLPFEVLHRLRHFPLNSSNIDVLMSKLPFDDGLCNRCSNIAIPSLSPYFPLMFVLPRKEGLTAEFVSMRNRMVKDGFLLPYYVMPEDVRFDPNYFYNPEATMDRRLPFFFYITYSMPPILSSYFMPSPGLLESYFQEFIKRAGEDSETRIACQIMRDAYDEDNSVFCKFQDAIGNNQTLRELATAFFPQTTFLSGTSNEKTMNRILGFVTFLMEKMIASYLSKEEMIGR